MLAKKGLVMGKKEQQNKLMPVRLIVVHPLNDFSGSPRVLADFLTCDLLNPKAVTIITSRSSGFLHSGLGQRRLLCYPRWQVNVLKILSFVFVQFQLFVATFCTILRSNFNGERVVVIHNTMLSMGSMLAAKIFRVTNVVYLHEWTVGSKRVGRIVRFLSKSLIRFVADEVLFVSQFLSDVFEFGDTPKTIVLANGLRADFDPNPTIDHKSKFKQGKVLFVGYLKKNKGIFELLKIAESMPSRSFQAVLNCSPSEIEDFVANFSLPKNLELLPQQVDIQRYYQEAFLVINLSLADACLESFSLSILEGMSCGNPVIVPLAGGHFEYFDSSAGKAINAQSTGEIIAFIERLQNDFVLWRQHSQSAVRLVGDYSAAAFQDRVERFLSKFFD
tara:strand:+ start:2155 stop:3321 length:1167 start_codon:yes stop_codon:yes gene_type:complete